MRKIEVALFLLLFPILLVAQDNLSALIPMPNHIEIQHGKSFRVKESTTCIVCTDASLCFESEQLSEIFHKRMQVELPVVHGKTKKNMVSLSLDTLMAGGSERYKVEISSHHLAIIGATPAAVYRGIMTIDQLLLGDVGATKQHQVTPIRIDDAPRFHYRALMLDPARHFLSVEEVKFYIDQMAKYKYNVLQLHLTDDQGWRMEIKSLPRLASSQHYTQVQLKELIDYAQLRHIQIIPEIDVPGHTVAILSAYPELACKHRKGEIMEVGKTVNRMLCAANPRTYSILENVFREVSKVFEAPYIHLGGDEAAVPDNWAKCPDCRKMMQKYGYEKPTQLMLPFFQQVLQFVQKQGKHPILWCELNNIYPPATDFLFPYPGEVTLVSWRNGLTPACLELTHKNGNPILLAPGEYAYFDYPQWKGDLPEYNNWGMPTTSLEKTYTFDPGYGLPSSQQQHILGVMGTLWGEAISDINRATYMTYPRGLALAEAGWTMMSNRSWKSFKQRLYPNLLSLMKSGVSVRVPFEIAR